MSWNTSARTSARANTHAHGRTSQPQLPPLPPHCHYHHEQQYYHWHLIIFCSVIFLRNFSQQYIIPLFKLPAEIKRLFWRRTMTRKVWADKGRDPPSYNQCVHPAHHRLWRQLLRAHSLARRKTDWSDNSPQRDMQRDTTYCAFAHHKDNVWR